ncbi:MAG: transketolase [Eubacterium sp.]|nr:transketolase [Eubacterium sp.]
MAKKEEVLRLMEIAHQMRKNLVKLCGAYGGNIHMGGDMSMSDVLTCLYHHTMHVNPEDIHMPDRDRFILSKGHGAVCMYITMALRGFFDYDEIVRTYGQLDSAYGQHPCKVHLPGVEASTGSLGHGLPICVGMAAAARQRKENHRVFCMMGDGETCEGSVWEAALNAPALKLGNLVAIVDRNKQFMTTFSEEGVHFEPYADKWRAFGWNVIEINGNDMNEVVDAFDSLPAADSSVPTVIVANTVKGARVSFMEKQIKWHCGSLDAKDLAIALDDLEAAYQAEKEAL